MGWFHPRRDPTDPHQLRIAIHELGHAAVWTTGGFTVRQVVHEGDDGRCAVTWNPDNAEGYLAGFWGGYEAENLWARTHHTSRARRGNSGHDIHAFRDANRNLYTPVSEAKARSIARAAVRRHWARIEDLAPRLITAGRLTGLRF